MYITYTGAAICPTYDDGVLAGDIEIRPYVWAMVLDSPRRTAMKKTVVMPFNLPDIPPAVG